MSLAETVCKCKATELLNVSISVRKLSKLMYVGQCTEIVERAEIVKFDENKYPERVELICKCTEHVEVEHKCTKSCRT